MSPSEKAILERFDRLLTRYVGERHSEQQPGCVDCELWSIRDQVEQAFEGKDVADPCADCTADNCEWWGICPHSITDDLMEAPPGSPEADNLNVLCSRVEVIEEENFPIDLPDPITAIKFRMEQEGIRQIDLVPIFGSRAKVSEVLSGKRRLSLPMIRGLHERLGISADILIQEIVIDVRDPSTNEIEDDQ